MQHNKRTRPKDKNYKPTKFPEWLPKDVAQFAAEYEAVIYQGALDYRLFALRASEKKFWNEIPGPKYRAKVELEAIELLEIWKKVLPVYCAKEMRQIWDKLRSINPGGPALFAKFIIQALHQYRACYTALLQMRERQELLEKTKENILEIEKRFSELDASIKEIEGSRSNTFGVLWCQAYPHQEIFKPLLADLEQKQKELIARKDEIASHPYLSSILNRKFKPPTGEATYLIRKLHKFMTETFGKPYPSLMAKIISLIFKTRCSANRITKICSLQKK